MIAQTITTTQHGTKVFIPSSYQVAIFDWIETGRGDGIVNAVAGAGKSTTLVQSAQRIKAARAIFLAFNKHIAESLSGKLAGTTMQAKTIHSVGNGMVYKHYGKTRIEGNKYYKLAQKWADMNRFVLVLTGTNPLQAARVLSKLADMARLTLADEKNEAALARLADLYVGEEFRETADAVMKGVPWVLAEGIKQAEYGKVIDFTDMIWLPVRMEMQAPQMDWVLIDECQDLNACQLALVLKLRAPGGRMLFVGDPCQAIMGFAGADTQSFQKIKARTNAKEMPLSICYRCPTSHLDKARELVPQIEARPGAPVGIYEVIKEANLIKSAREGDLMLCRMTAPLIRWCIKFIEQKISARVRGRDVGKDLTDLAKGIASNAGVFDYATEFGRLLAEFEEAAVAKLMQGGESNESRIEALRDRVEALRICYENFKVATLDDLCAEIEALFSDERSSIWLSTIHRAKGLEEKRVFIVEPDKLPLRWKGQTPEQLTQEYNLQYVALTRSLAELYIVEK